MPKIAIVGEAWGAEEEKAQAPFVGYSGHELTRMLSEAGIHRSECFLTNVFNQHPPGNKLEWFCGPKSEALAGYPPLGGKYVRSEFLGEISRLQEELLGANPNLILALGNTASWALLGRTAVSKFRGTTVLSTHTVLGFKVLVAYHPAAITRQWDLRPVTILDFVKAKREAEFPEIRRPKREIWIEPNLEDFENFYSTFIAKSRILSVDIETVGSIITCIGFSPGSDVGLVIPFYDNRRPGRVYWGDLERERAAWGFVKKVLGNPAPPKLFQNGMYDIAFLWRAYGIKVMGAEHDTMLLHHALQPEALKGLGFLGSVYTDEGAWKQMRDRTTTIKRDE